jgi:hypothetical protein
MIDGIAGGAIGRVRSVAMLQRIVVFAHGNVSYLVFLGALLFAVGFAGNFPSYRQPSDASLPLMRIDGEVFTVQEFYEMTAQLPTFSGQRWKSRTAGSSTRRWAITSSEWTIPGRRRGSAILRGKSNQTVTCADRIPASRRARIFADVIEGGCVR